MSIQKVKITNFKCFYGTFELNLNSSTNIIVGNNNSGKSTIIEAIHLALTGRHQGKNITNDISEYLFNKKAVQEYIQSLESQNPQEPPSIIIEVFLTKSTEPLLEGSHNSEMLIGTEGFKLEIAFDNQFKQEYQSIIKNNPIKTLPIEYYKTTWTSFADSIITPRTLPLKSTLIDTSATRNANGTDSYITKTIKDLLTNEEEAEVARAHRGMKEFFMSQDAIKLINSKINNNINTICGDVSVGVDLGYRSNWEQSLTTQIDQIPFNFLSKGSQTILKTELALHTNYSTKTKIILIEEPENHLSYTKLSTLISDIQRNCQQHQIIISTHSSFVANKLGLHNLILLSNQKKSSTTQLKGF